MTPDQLISQCRLAIRWAESVQRGEPIEIEILTRGRTWIDCNPSWNLEQWEYREKPRPREAWTVPSLMWSREQAELYASAYGGTVVHMREVME